LEQKKSAGVTDQCQEIDQCFELILTEMAKVPFVLLRYCIVEIVYQLPSLFREPGCDEAPVFIASLPGDESRFFHSVEQPGRIGHPIHQTGAHVVPAKTFRSGSPQDPEHVVLRDSDSVGLEHLLHRVQEQIGCSGDVQVGLFLKVPEGLFLFDLVLELD
jgi:hypothetical protein